MRAALYLRNALSDNGSLERQKTALTEWAAEKAWTVASVYSDNGAKPPEDGCYPALRSLLNDARDGKFDIVLVTELTRFSRETEQCIRICSELQSHGIGVTTLRDGEVSQEWIAANAVALELGGLLG